MPDNVVFLADCISSRETLDKVEQMEAAMFAPAHAQAQADVKELVRYNRDKVYEAAEKILYICGGAGLL